MQRFSSLALAGTVLRTLIPQVAPSLLLLPVVRGHSMASSSATSCPRSGGGTPIARSSFLNQERAIQVDVDLMSQEGGFSIDQLMELAGLSVACSVAKEFPTESHPNVLIICGPGNNGGDGLVAARHLHHFGYRPRVVYPKMQAVTAKNELYRRLVVQLAGLGIPITDVWAQLPEGEVHVVIDAIFGFSFKGWRGEGKDAPFDEIISLLGSEALRPDMLVSLTAPKQCALLFKGEFHYLGGRFVPPLVIERNGLELPVYPGAEQCVRLAAAL